MKHSRSDREAEDQCTDEEVTPPAAKHRGPATSDTHSETVDGHPQNEGDDEVHAESERGSGEWERKMGERQKDTE